MLQFGQERDKKKSDQCLQSTRIIRNCQYGRPKHATANLSILSSSQNYCCSAILFARRLTSSENWPMMSKNTWPHAYPIYSSTGQRSGFVVADKQTKPAQSLLSHPWSTEFNILRGDGRNLKLTQCCRGLCLKPSALSCCNLPRFCK